MPNWVYSTMVVSGDETKLAELIARAGKTSPTWAETTGEDKLPVLSFGNFIAPPQEVLDSGEYHQTRGFVAGEKSGQTPNNWYEWNIREWGTKWDACEVQLTESSPTEIVFTFETAWAPPLPVYSKIAEMYPELTFSISYEEEQGWGATVESEAGNTGDLVVTKEWDIPNSHKDYVALDREESCVCSYEEDAEEWYTDCPQTASGEFEVAITRILKVTARDSEHAQRLVEEALAELPTIERQATGETDPFTIEEYDNGVELEVLSEKKVTA